MSSSEHIVGVGERAVAEKGWLRSTRWLLLRRVSQASILLLFLLGPIAGVWIVKGNLASSMTLNVLPLTDPYVIVQSVAAGHMPYTTALIGAAIMLAFYALLGGRVYCSWVCPVNIVTDAAAWLRRKMAVHPGRTPPKHLRYWLLGATIVGSYLTGTILWEWVNPVSMLHRGLIFGFGLAWAIVLGVFIFDFAIARRGWCGHVCPMGAFYSLLGRYSLPRVSASGRVRCNDCMDCYAVCPEPGVITPALRASAPATPLISSSACTTCGRCIDVCSKNVFRLTTRFDHRSET
ncbi:MAG: quinol dehydrogenase ferredoxin subunit NapH [Burkholderiales bacterium]